jgi:hypothetical protein
MAAMPCCRYMAVPSSCGMAAPAGARSIIAARHCIVSIRYACVSRSAAVCKDRSGARVAGRHSASVRTTLSVSAPIIVAAGGAQPPSVGHCSSLSTHSHGLRAPPAA